MKKCKQCNKQLPEAAFTFCKKREYRHPTCKKCEYAARKLAASTPRGRAQRMWDGICSRAGNRSGAYPTYKDVEIHMSREEFIRWAIPELTIWYRNNPNDVPTIDRIDSSGHYEIDNLRILSMSENVHFRGSNKNILAPEGMAWCFLCKKYLAKDRFYKNRRNANGLSAGCKLCHGARYNNVKKPHPTQSEVDAVVSRYDNGESAPEIAKDCGRSKSWVYNTINKHRKSV